MIRLIKNFFIGVKRFFTSCFWPTPEKTPEKAVAIVVPVTTCSTTNITVATQATKVNVEIENKVEEKIIPLTENGITEENEDDIKAAIEMLNFNFLNHLNEKNKKEFAVKEIKDTVKSNFQTISSILDQVLKIYEPANGEVRSLLAKMKTSFNMIKTNILNSGFFDTYSLDDYSEKVIKAIQSNNSADSESHIKQIELAKKLFDDGKSLFNLDLFKQHQKDKHHHSIKIIEANDAHIARFNNAATGHDTNMLQFR